MRYARHGFFLLLLVLLVIPPAYADTGGPDPDGYTFIDSEQVDGPAYSWVEISGSGQLLDGAFTDLDNGYAGPFPLGFPFPYYGQIYTHFYVYVNGYVQLARPGDPPGNGATLPPLPDPLLPNTVLAPFSTDLYLFPQVSHVYYDYDGANRLGIVEFVDMQYCCGLNHPHTFEIILYPDGHVLMQYQLVRPLRPPHIGYTAGIEGPDGVSGLGYAAGFVDTEDTVHNELAVLYVPGPDIYGFAFLDVDPEGQCEDPGLDLLYQGDLMNLTGYTTTFTLSYTVAPTDWQVTLPDVVGPITNANWLLFPITVTIPVSATFDDTAQVTVTAVAAMSPSIVVSDTFAAGVADRDLVLSKGLAPDIPPAPGGLFRYALDVYNGITPWGDCGAQARDIVLTDTLPAGMILVDVYPPPLITPTQIITWSLGALDEGEAATFYIEMRVPTMTTIPTYLTNTARVEMSGTVERGPFDNNAVSLTTVVTEPWLDLWVAKWLEAGTPVPGGQLTYGIAYANAGNVPAEGPITITETLPDGVDFVTATTPFTWNNGVLVWTIDRLENRTWDPEELYLTVQISINLPDGFSLTNAVMITMTPPLSPTLPDVDPLNNRDVLTLTVRDLRADVWVEKLLPEIGGVPVIPEPGSDYTYWIHYGNAGAGAAYTVTLSDLLPISSSVLYAGSAGGAAPVLTDTGRVTWPIPTLAAGAENWVRLTLMLDQAIASGTVLTNSVAITNMAGYDITPTNNADAVTITLEAADVTITKTVCPTGEVDTGDLLTYVLRYHNAGALAATGVVIADSLPEGLVPVEVITAGASLQLVSGTRYLWNVETLEQGQGGAITITTWVQPSFAWPAPALLTNTAHISTTRGEGLSHAPNEATVVTPVRVLWHVYLPLVMNGATW